MCFKIRKRTKKNLISNRVMVKLKKIYFFEISCEFNDSKKIKNQFYLIVALILINSHI